MASVITIAGEKLFAAKAQANEQLDIDTFIFANVPAQDATAPINREEDLPTDHVVHQQIVQQVGRINDNVVVYSTVLDSITGPFEFNWVGLYSSINNTLVAINHVPTTPKTATVAGVAGNTLNRNFGIEYSGIAELTGIDVAPETWQLDFTARLQGMDKLTQQLAADMNGQDWFIEDGFKVEPRETVNTFKILPGVGYVSGLRVELENEHIFNVESYPQFIYVDVWFEGDANSTWSPSLMFTISDTELDDYKDGAGIKHYVDKLAEVTAFDVVVDLREESLSADKQWVGEKADINKVLIKTKTGGNVTQELIELSDKFFKKRVNIKFPDNSKLYLDPVFTRFSESIIDLGTCHIVPTTENVFTWKNAGARNKWRDGKFEPEGYSKESKHWGVLWINDTVSKSGGNNKWDSPFMYGMHRCIRGISDDSFGGACYRHEITNPDLTGHGKSKEGGFGIHWGTKSGRVGDSAGNDSKITGGSIRSFESDVIMEKAFAPKITNTGLDGALHGCRNIGSSYLQIVNQYTEFCDNGLTLEDGPYGTQMIGGTVASSVTTKINGSQHADLPVYVVSVSGVENCLSVGVRESSGGVQHICAPNKLGLGLYDKIDNLLTNEIFLKIISANALGFDCSEIFQECFHFYTADKTLKLGGDIPLEINSNGEVEVANGRFFKGMLNLKTSQRKSGLANNTIFLEEGTEKMLFKNSNGEYREIQLSDGAV